MLTHIQENRAAIPPPPLLLLRLPHVIVELVEFYEALCTCAAAPSSTKICFLLLLSLAVEEIV